MEIRMRGEERKRGDADDGLRGNEVVWRVKSRCKSEFNIHFEAADREIEKFIEWRGRI